MFANSSRIQSSVLKDCSEQQCFRESLEAAIIVSVLLGLVEQIVKGRGLHGDTGATGVSTDGPIGGEATLITGQEGESAFINQRKLLRKLRIQVSLHSLDKTKHSYNLHWLLKVISGSVIGLFVALAM